LNSLTAANNRAQMARNKIADHCHTVYGVEPGDVDNDEFIDAVDGGSGRSSGMTVEEFDRSMRESMKINGAAMPTEHVTSRGDR